MRIVLTMLTFTPQERLILSLICDTFVPAPDETTSPDSADRALIDALIEALDRVADEKDRVGLKLFLRTIQSGRANRITAGVGKPFSAMRRDERERVLRAWAYSDQPLARQLFQSLKRLTLFLAYTMTSDEQPNPLWQAIGYAAPERARFSGARPITPLRIMQPTTLTCDVVIVGSGAGGGVVAGELTDAGYDVIVVEKGDYYHDGDFHGRELESHEKLFEKYGSLTTSDKSMLVLAGSVLGGGTTINWAASLPTPDEVREEWARDYGFSGANSAAFARSSGAVWSRLHVNAETAATAQNCALEDGCKKLGYDVTAIPRNVKDCQECGFCNFGCFYGAKQSTLKTYLDDAFQRGARVIVRGYTERVLVERGSARGVQVTVMDEIGQAHDVTIRAKAVVAAAGAIHTPALLLRSGLVNPHIGAHLHLHPVTVVYGIFDQPIRGWEGAPMTRVSRQFADLDGQGYGVRLETAPVHPGIAALSLPWETGQQHRATMAQLAHLGNIIIITRDRYGGRVTLDKRGRPVLHYRLHPHDARHMMGGILEALRTQHAAGAKELSSPHARRLVWRSDDGWKDFETYLAAVEAAGLKPNTFSLFSAHQMSSARIGGSMAVGAVDPSGETYEVRHLYVADASVLPSATGVNPMISIMATAHYLAQQMKTRI